MNIKWAIQSGDLVKVQDLLELGVDPNVNVPGNLLAYAGYWGHVDVMELLVRKGTNVDAPDVRGWTPLMVAAARTNAVLPPPPDDNAAAVEFLLSRKAALNARSRLGWTALMLAVGRGSSTVQSILRVAGADEAGIMQARFVHAVESNSLDDIRRLIAQGASIDAANEPVGWTALGSAARRGEPEAVRALLEVGASVDYADERQMTPLWHAAAVEEWAYNENYLTIVKMLLDAGANVNCQPEGAWPILAIALEEGLDEIAELLIQAGANLPEASDLVERRRADCQQKIALTPDPSSLAYVIGSNRDDLVRQFIEKGVDVNADLGEGVTPLMCAAREARPITVRLLLDAGADPCRKTDYGETAIKNAALSGKDEIVRILIEAGVAANSPDALLARRWAQQAKHEAVLRVFDRYN